MVKTSIGEKICTEFVEGLNDLSEEQKSDIRNRSIRLAESDIHLTLNNVSVANDILEEIQKLMINYYQICLTSYLYLILILT